MGAASVLKQRLLSVRSIVLLGALAMSSACGMLVDGNGAAEIAESQTDAPFPTFPDLEAKQASAARDCLMVIWADRDTPENQREFDRTHDRVEGGAISCATGSSPSEFAAALADIRKAAAANDRTALIEEMRMPLLYIDMAGGRSDVLADELTDGAFDAVFTPQVMSLMQGLDLKDMTVVPDQGAFFALGAVWLMASEKGGRPRLVTVNSQALAEALANGRKATASS